VKGSVCEGHRGERIRGLNLNTTKSAQSGYSAGQDRIGWDEIISLHKNPRNHRIVCINK
jgi:hypothetical protein